ncbi:MAG: hypothetical protein M9936_11775 [Caldilinea sp.]|nr:hypothetical protein [Caldilinea sp.]MCB0057209.1 hypothetical protein [Caldilineaceae bacterium]MCB0149634.1 hypothetical protein [Caldilineaceae bacterium]MCB9115237.1 hypothetical protein [Caldilineaceae bacterium]MCO5210368.1 hypothetical protein [Caldilinea sp.]
MAQLWISATHPAPVIMVGLIKFFKRIVALLLIPLVLAFVLQAYFSVTANVIWQDLTWMLVGLIGYFVLYVVLIGNSLRFFEVFEHELNHTITAMLSLGTVLRFRVFPAKDENALKRSESGQYAFEGDTTALGSGCFLVVLAPYFLPLFTIPLLVIRPLTPELLVPVANVVIGVTLGFHFAGLANEFRTYQTDIKLETLPFSVVITLLFNVIILVLVISVVIDNVRLTFEYLRDATARSFDYYRFIAAWIAQFGILAKLQEVVALLSA